MIYRTTSKSLACHWNTLYFVDLGTRVAFPVTARLNPKPMASRAEDILRDSTKFYTCDCCLSGQLPISARGCRGLDRLCEAVQIKS
jgi:hypothetical protein